MTNGKELTRAAGTVFLITLIGRILGLVRDMLIAGKIGISVQYDAFLVGMIIPEGVGTVLTTAIPASLIPLVSPYLHRDEERGWSAFSNIFTLLIFPLFIFVGLFVITMPWLIQIIAPGFSGGTYHLSIKLSRILLPLILFSGVAILFSAMLNSYKRFALPAIGPMILNTIIIFFLLQFTSTLGIMSLVIGFLVGRFFHVLVQAYPLHKFSNGRYSLLLDLSNPDVKRFIDLFLPILAMLSILYSNAIIVRIFASTLPGGSISALYYANRLMMLPAVLIAGAAGVVLLPSISILADMKDERELIRYLRLTLRLMVFFLAPTLMGIIILRFPIVSILFEWGVFTFDDTKVVSTLLVYYIGVMMAFPLCTIFRQFLYALQYPKPLIRISLVFVSIQVFCCFFLMQLFELNGLALAASLSTIIYALLLYREIRKQLGEIVTIHLIKSLLTTVFVSSVAGFCIYSVYHIISSNNFSQINLLNHIFYLGIPVLSGLLLFLVLSHFFRMQELTMFTKFLQNKFTA